MNSAVVDLQLLGPHAAALRPPLLRLLKFLGIRRGNWTITIIRDPQMKALHKRTLNLNTTTDVLTFDLRDNPVKSQISNFKSQMAASLDLDTVLCLDQARRRAKELHHPLKHELLLYALHSLLHVQGYDDTTPQQSARMHAREDELLTKIGIGPVYQTLNSQLSNFKFQISNSKSEISNFKSQLSNLKSKSSHPPRLRASVVRTSPHSPHPKSTTTAAKNHKSPHSKLRTKNSELKTPNSELGGAP